MKKIQIEYKGPAAAAMIATQEGRKLKSKKEKLARIATMVYACVAPGHKKGMDTASHLLERLLAIGINKLSAELILPLSEPPTQPATPRARRAPRGGSHA